MTNNHFVIVVGSRNNSQWVESNLGSILSQDYHDYEVMYFDDASEDDTVDKVQKMVGTNHRFHLYSSPIRQYKTYYFAEHLNNFWDNTILVFLDGDDMFASENVLRYLNEVYNQTGCWMTYGGMLVWEGGEKVTEPTVQNSTIPTNIIAQKAYRKDQWRTSHLKSMRAFVWNKLDKADLRPDGKYMVGPDDLAIMFGALELCPPDKVYRVKDSIYLYNHSVENQHSRAFTDHRKVNIDYERIIRERKPYDTISFVTPTLAGGLGNQMFEIAAAASLAKDNNAVLIVNNDEHILPNQGRNVNTYANNIFNRIMFDKSLPIQNLCRRDLPVYDQIPYQPNLKLLGHFQSWKYFDHNRDYIQKLFSPSECYSEYHKYTAIQVRRGDYIKFPDHHPLLPAEYYMKAAKLTNSTHIAVFSDDIAWCKDNLHFDVPIEYVKHEDYIELCIMAQCKNLIISNSSFGWWAAYLNRIPDKKIFVPSIWFGPAIVKEGFNMDDLVMPDWIKV